ncbi:MAG: endonuclease domain-containing protein [Rhizobiaceae bacterium]|nr:endonuclease domain-containing protein [Rhizobiaceae bacterium]
MPHLPLADAKRGFARKLRRDMTEAEGRLWEELRDRRLDRLKFRRQVPVVVYIADFLCADAMLIVEVDGSQHGDSRHDIVRATELKARGFRVLRFWNDEVLQEMNSVCDTIIAESVFARPKPFTKPNCRRASPSLSMTHLGKELARDHDVCR